MTAQERWTGEGTENLAAAPFHIHGSVFKWLEAERLDFLLSVSCFSCVFVFQTGRITQWELLERYSVCQRETSSLGSRVCRPLGKVTTWASVPVRAELRHLLLKWSAVVFLYYSGGQKLPIIKIQLTISYRTGAEFWTLACRIVLVSIIALCATILGRYRCSQAQKLLGPFGCWPHKAVYKWNHFWYTHRKCFWNENRRLGWIRTTYSKAE